MYLLQLGTYIFPQGFYPAHDEIAQVVPRVKLPRYDGARQIRGSLAERSLGIRGQLIKGPVSTPGLTTLQSSFDSLLVNLIANAPANLYFGDSTRYLRNVQMERFPKVWDPTGYDRMVSVDIALVASDPFYYSTTLSSDAWSVSSNSAAHTVSTSTMTAYALPQISIVAGGAGAQTIAYTFLNQTTGKSFTLSGSVNGGDTIVVDCLNQTVTIGGVDRMDLFDGVFMALISGGNAIVPSYGVTTLTYVGMSYNARYY